MFLLVLARPDSPGQRAIKRFCVCVCTIVICSTAQNSSGIFPLMLMIARMLSAGAKRLENLVWKSEMLVLVCAELIRDKVAEARESLLHEFDAERSHHQKMMGDYTRLQQRFDNLQSDMQLLTSNTAPGRLPFDFQQADIADSVTSDMSDAGGDTVSLDGTRTVSQVNVIVMLACLSLVR